MADRREADLRKWTGPASQRGQGTKRVILTPSLESATLGESAIKTRPVPAGTQIAPTDKEKAYLMLLGGGVTTKRDVRRHLKSTSIALGGPLSPEIRAGYYPETARRRQEGDAEIRGQKALCGKEIPVSLWLLKRDAKEGSWVSGDSPRLGSARTICAGTGSGEGGRSAMERNPDGGGGRAIAGRVGQAQLRLYSSEGNGGVCRCRLATPESRRSQLPSWVECGWSASPSRRRQHVHSAPMPAVCCRT